MNEPIHCHINPAFDRTCGVCNPATEPTGNAQRDLELRAAALLDRAAEALRSEADTSADRWARALNRCAEVRRLAGTEAQSPSFWGSALGGES